MAKGQTFYLGGPAPTDGYKPATDPCEIVCVKHAGATIGFVVNRLTDPGERCCSSNFVPFIPGKHLAAFYAPEAGCKPSNIGVFEDWGSAIRFVMETALGELI